MYSHAFRNEYCLKSKFSQANAAAQMFTNAKEWNFSIFCINT